MKYNYLKIETVEDQSSILLRSNFGVGRQVRSPQSLTAYSLDR
jgi:hypothetical protein